MKTASVRTSRILRNRLLMLIVVTLLALSPVLGLAETTEPETTDQTTVEIAETATEKVADPTPTPTEVVEPTPTPADEVFVTIEVPTETSTSVVEPTVAVTETATETATAEATATATATATQTSEPTATPLTPTPTATAKSGKTAQLAAAKAGTGTCALFAGGPIVAVGQYVTYECVGDSPVKIRGTGISSGWQWAYSFATVVVPTTWFSGNFEDLTSASGNIDTVYVYLSPTASSQPGSTGSLTVELIRPNGNVQATIVVSGIRSVTTADFQLVCTPTPITVATSATGTVNCTLSGINVAASATITVNSVTVSSLASWTITRAPTSGSLTGAAGFAFTLSLTPVCGAAVNPLAPNVTITSALTFQTVALTGPSTSITAKHGATSTVNASITASTISWTNPYSFAPQLVSGSMTYQVVASGCAGWNIQVSASSFAYTGTAGGAPIANSNIAVNPGAVVGVSGSNTTNVSAGTAGTLAAALKVLNAIENNGIGTYDQSLGVDVTIPGGARVGTYTSTVTVTAASGP